jgi:hypothetical protein
MVLFNSFIVLDERDGNWKVDLGHTIEGQRGQFKDELELMNAITDKRRADPEDPSSKLISFIRTVGIAKEGKQGPMGPQGPIGAPGGPAGPQGDRGDKGEKGDRGNDGRDGNRGQQGERGPAGDKGKDGRDGSNGRDGERGPQGEKGPPGKDGSDGRNGVDGQKGEAGPRGVDGPRGSDGRHGISGWIKAVMAEEFKVWDDRDSGTRHVNRARDKRNQSLEILRYDDTDPMGAGFFVTFPRAANKVRFRIRGRHTQAKGAEKTHCVVMTLLFREIGESGVGSWQKLEPIRHMVAYTEIGLEKYHLAKAEHGFGSLRQDTDYQMMLVRDAKHADDNLPGDFMVQSLVIEVD